MPARRALLHTTRARVLAGALVLLGATIAASVLAIRALLLSRLDDRVDRELAQEVEEFQNLAGGVDPSTGDPFGSDLAAIFDTFLRRNVPATDEVLLGILGGEPYLRSAGAPFPIEDLTELVQRWADAPVPAYRTDSTPGGQLRSLVVPVAAPDGTLAGSFVVAIFPAGERDEVDDAVRIASLVGFAAFVLASAAAWAIAGRVLAPLRELAEGSARISEDNLGERIPVQGTGELAELTVAFNGMLDRVLDAVEARRAFLDDAGHELRTPITVIRGHLEIADPEAPLPVDTRDIVFDELDRMGRIVEDLLVIAKAERPDFVIPGPVDIGDLTEEVAAKARPLADRTWEVRAAPVVAEVDRDRIVQAWMNLIRNAVQHTASGDRITVFSAARDGRLELGVTDTGEGVAASDRDRIFERFGRGGSTRRTRSDGAGLGLAIVAAIADAHGGWVDLRDTAGGGATFVVSLPAGGAASPEEPAEASEGAPWPAS